MILEALFDGKIFPAEDVVPQSDRYKKVIAKAANMMADFENRLSKELKLPT